MTAAIVLGTRLLLVLLFLPFSALDKISNFSGARAQCALVLPAALATPVLLCGLFIEVVMSLCVVTGLHDRAAALVLALYCIATAFGWKRFWREHHLCSKPDSLVGALFWDFWKNLAVAGGFLMLTFGTSVDSARLFIDAPFSSTNPYVSSRP